MKQKTESMPQTAKKVSQARASEITQTYRATQALINLQNLLDNLKKVRACLPPKTRICASIKANAYGHGSVATAQTLRQSGVYMLGVSSPLEALTIREAGDTGPILLYGPTVPEEIPLSLRLKLELMLTDREYLRNIQIACQKWHREREAGRLRLHLKVDTGMGRVGCRPDESLELAERISRNPLFELAGLATHFPLADSDAPQDMEFTHSQLQQFLKLVQSLKNAGIQPGLIHTANSGAIALHPDSALDMVRPGLALYGYAHQSGAFSSHGMKLQPVMQLRSRVTALKRVQPGQSISYGRTWKASRPTWIATVPVGYADGYPRCLSNKAKVLVGKKQCPIVGTVCMDQLMVDLGGNTDVCLYDSVTLFGPSPEGPDAAHLATLAGTITYEITCGISKRVPRIYTEKTMPPQQKKYPEST